MSILLYKTYLKICRILKIINKIKYKTKLNTYKEYLTTYPAFLEKAATI
jgi:hypothetical protein